MLLPWKINELLNKLLPEIHRWNTDCAFPLSGFMNMQKRANKTLDKSGNLQTQTRKYYQRNSLRLLNLSLWVIILEI